MQEAVAKLLSLTLMIVITAAVIGALYGIGRFAMNCPKYLKWHFITALVWTAMTGIWIAIIMTSTHNCFSSYFILGAAGSVFLASWIRLLERRRGGVTVQAQWKPLSRLFVQTLVGPVLVFAAALFFLIEGQQYFERTVAQKNLPTAFFLRDVGLGDPDALRKDLYGAVDREDIDGVRMCIRLGVPVSDGYEYSEDYPYDYENPLRRAVELEDTTITRLLLQHDKSADCTSLLQHAVEGWHVAQARLLLQNGADRKAVNSMGLTPFQVAKQNGDKEMVALLLSDEGKGK